ncbi:MAG: rhodanese-like domain-containing protein [Thermoanaerobaculia bacterium]
MLDRRFFSELAAIVGAGILCALVANALAGRERQLALDATYRNAMTVTKRSEAPALPASTTTPLLAPATTTTASLEAPATDPAAATTPAPTTTAAPPTTPAPARPAAAQPSPAQPAPSRIGKFFPPHPDRPFVEINYEDARVLFDRKALILDARRSSAYEQGHIAGAKSISVWEADVDDKVAAMAMAGLDGNAPIIIYCSGGNCEDSHMLADKLFGVGFNNVYVYKDGFPDWQKNGAPVETGAER